jgi:peroxiredoxin
MRAILSSLFLFAAMAQAGVNGFNVGDKATDFNLKNIDGKTVSLADFKDARGYIVIFTCNTCPYARAYESRIVKLHEKFADQGYPVIAINPNDPDIQPGDSYEAMVQRATQQGFNFPYLVDVDQQVAKTYGAVRTPQVFLLEKDLTVAYIGAIDNNYKSDDESNTKYLENAVQSLMNGKSVEVSKTKAIGCGIKWKKI